MGKLNLLHHKSWHVYSEKNRERVRKDEEEARQKEDKEKQRQLQADQEGRLELLRKRAQRDKHSHKDASAPVERFNLFQVGQNKTNDEYESEKKAETKKWEDKYTWYLAGQGGIKDNLPWYVEDPQGLDKYGEKKRLKEKEDRLKLDLDPISHLNSYKKKPQSVKLIEGSGSNSSIEQLRQERLKREQRERQKAQMLLNPDKRAQVSTQAKLHQEDSKYYHSQFNPDAVRRPGRHRPY